MHEDEDDFSLFRDSVKGVKKIQVNQADVGKPPPNRQQIKAKQAHATEKLNSIAVDGMSDQFVLDVGPEDPLLWIGNGVQEGQMRKLKAGQIEFEGSLDLHGMTVEVARNTLWEFLAEATRREVRCVRVTHGKAARLDGRRPLIKSHVNTWLRQHPSVLGFCSCVPRHGGTGSLYLLLKRTALDGRDE